MTGWTWLALALAGAVGAVLRYTTDATIGALTFRTFPYGTLVINLIGSFVLGLVTGLALDHSFPATPKLVIGSGFCGAFTTFSTFGFETVTLARSGDRSAAGLNVAGNVVGGCLAAAAGLAIAAL